MGVVGGCIYRLELTEASILRTVAFVNTPLTEVVALSRPPPLIDLPRQTA